MGFLCSQTYLMTTYSTDWAEATGW